MIPFLYTTVNTLYHGVMDHMPQALQDRDKASAFVLGATGIYCVVRSLQWLSRNLVDKFIPGFDNRALPIIEKVCIAGMAAAPLVYAFIDPNGATEIMTQHPTYTAGMAGVLAGSITGAAQDLHSRSKQADLEKKLSD